MKNKTTRTISTIAALALSLICVFGGLKATGESEKPEQPPLKIGLIASLTGPASPGGRDMVAGAELYLEKIHHQIAGRKVELIVEDDESHVPTAIGKIIKLVNKDHVNVLEGILLSNIVYAAAPYIDKLQVPLL